MADTDQVLNLAAIIRKVDGNHSKGAAALAESILDHPGFRAVLADESAAPKGREWPSDEELLDLRDWMADEWAANHDAELPLSQYARAVLARWGKVAPVPVSVSERLPGPEDCDEDGRCWWLHVGEDGVGDWFQRAPYPSVTSYAFFRMTHWLPAHALPLPEVGA